MIGIYMYTNKLNNKKYVGQSIHCGKRFDQHFKGKQLIDDIIQLEGIENFNFEILKQVDKPDLSYWEDYFIMKNNSMFPNGYNRKWNCSAAIREQIQEVLEEELAVETTPEHLKTFKDVGGDEILKTPFLKYPSDKNLLISMNYEDNLYAWLLLQAHYNQNEDYYYLYKNSFTFIQLSESLKKSRQTISKEFKRLQDLGLVTEGSNFGEKIYILPCHASRFLCRNTLSTLLEISCERGLNELIKTFICTLNIKKENKISQPIAASEILNYFNHSIGHKTSYERVRNNLEVLQKMPKIGTAIPVEQYSNLEASETLEIPLSTSPNQLIIEVNKPEVEDGVLIIDNEELQNAYKNLTHSGFALYLYFMENEDGCSFPLSSSDFCKKYSLSESSYRRAKRELKDKGYIADRDFNRFDFYSQPF